MTKNIRDSVNNINEAILYCIISLYHTFLFAFTNRDNGLVSLKPYSNI